MKILNTVVFLIYIHVTQVIFVTWLITISNGEMRSFEFVQNILKVQEYEVLEGDTINLICRPTFATDSDNVEIVGDIKKYVTDGELFHSPEGNITFTRNESVAILTIYNISRDDGDVFICSTPRQYLTIKVLYTPVDYPLFTSDYTPQYFCDDESHGPFEFNCTTEAGDPSVNMSLYIEKEGKNLTVNSADYDISGSGSFTYLSFVTYLNSSFNNARLVCSINQQLPAPYENYEKSSFLELSQRFSLHIHPSNYTITKRDEVINLICTSNVSGFLLEWSDIPLEDTQYNTSSANGSIQLIIFDYGSNVNGSMTIQCRGSCGGRVISQGVTISSDIKILESEDGNYLKTEFALMLWVLGPLCLMVIIPLFVRFVVLRCKGKGDNTSKVGDVNQTDINMDESPLPPERQHLGYSDTKSRGNQNKEQMIGEPTDKKENIEGENQNLTTTDNMSQNNSSIEMTDNPEYEPFSPKLESETNCMDDCYATVC